MQHRLEILCDYMQLRILLNKTNSKSNQKTEIHFFIKSLPDGSTRLYATLNFTNAKTLELCKKNKNHTWRSSGYSTLIYLEDFCSEFLKKNLGFSNDPIKQIQTAENLKSLLTTLLIN